MKYCVLNVHKKAKITFSYSQISFRTDRFGVLKQSTLHKQQQLFFVLFLVVFTKGNNKLSHMKRNMVLYIFIYNGSCQRHIYIYIQVFDNNLINSKLERISCSFLKTFGLTNWIQDLSFLGI